MHALTRLAKRVKHSDLALLGRLAENAAEAAVPSNIRQFSKLPGEYAGYYGNSKQPVRRTAPPPVEAAEVESPGNPVASTSAAPVTDLDAESQRRSAAAVTRWMFPWEKRQMDDKQGPLKTWERLYWGLFVGALALLLFSRLPGAKDPADLEAAKEKEERRLKAARLLLAGQTSVREEDEDEFEGLAPQEIQAYVDRVLGENASSDPFDGLSPDEINAMLEDSQQKRIAA